MMFTSKVKIIIVIIVLCCVIVIKDYYNYKEQSMEEHLNKGWLYYKLLRIDKARDEFKTALNIASSAEAYYGIGVTYLETEPDKARQNLLTAEKLEPNHPYINFYLGSLAFMEKNYSEAIRYYEKAIAISTDNPGFYESLIEAYVFSGNKDKVRDFLKEYEKRFPWINDKKNNAIRCIIETGKTPTPSLSDWENEINNFEYQLKLNPMNYKAEYGLGLCYLQSEKGKAKEHLAKAIKIKSDYVEPYISMAEIYFTENDNTKTIEYCTKGITIAPKTSKLHLLLGLSYYRSGNKSKALEPLKKYLELDPDGTNANTVKQIIEQLK